MVLLISYDLNGHERPSSYSAIRDAIVGGSISTRRPLYSQWFVETHSTVLEWEQYLTPLIDTNDQLFICEVHRPRGGWLDKADWDWLNARV